MIIGRLSRLASVGTGAAYRSLLGMKFLATDTGTTAPPAQRWHDAGFSLEGLGPMPEEKQLAHWEISCDAMVTTLAGKGYFSVDEMRRAIESLPPPLYEKYGYYGRWAAAISSILVQKQIVPVSSLAAALWDDDVVSAPVKRWNVGDTVLVHPEDLRTRWTTPHLRVPGYIFGKEGVVERVCGEFSDPELLAFGPLKDPADIVPPSSKNTMYRVRFRQSDVNHLYEGGSNDTIDVEIYGNWLTTPRAASNSVAPSTPNPIQPVQPDPVDEHNHSHGHSHGDSEEEHEHLPRDEVEFAAVEKEGPPQIGERLVAALRHIAVEHSLITVSEIRSAIEKTETMNQKLLGLNIVAKAWVDPVFKQKLLDDAPAAIMNSFGVSTTNNTGPTILTFVENTDTVHNVIVCTLCSCYPRSILGLAPAWYKSRSYRARVVRNPRQVLEQDFGMKISEEVSVRVHDSTADLRYAVLPQRPEGTDHFSEEELAGLIPRDALLGVALVPSVE